MFWLCLCMCVGVCVSECTQKHSRSHFFITYTNLQQEEVVVVAATVVTAAKANDGFVRMCGCFTIYALWPINGTWCLLSSFFSLHRRHFLSEASWSAQNNKRRGNLVLSMYACIHAKGREIFLWKFPRLSFNKKSSQPKTLSGLYLFDGFRTFRHRINNE